MKIEEQVLSIEQMEHLQELGVDTSDASMCWLRYDADGEVKYYVSSNRGKCASCPTYTIGDLIEKLPIEINSFYRGIVIVRNYVGTGYLIDNLSPVSFSDLPLLESLYNLLCWVAENHKELLEVRNE